MTVFRWIIGVLAALMAVGALFGLFVLGVAFDSRLWLDRARRLRRWIWLAALLWFNVEVWGRVALHAVPLERLSRLAGRSEGEEVEHGAAGAPSKSPRAWSLPSSRTDRAARVARAHLAPRQHLVALGDDRESSARAA